PSPPAGALKGGLEALERPAPDGSAADAVEQLVHDPGTLVAATLGDAVRRTLLAEGARALFGAGAPASGDDPAIVRIGADPVTVVADLAARSFTFDPPAGSGRVGW